MAKKETKKVTTELVAKNSSNEMMLNAKVDMADIVSVFANKYEDALHKDADMARTGIKNLRLDIQNLEKESLASVNVSKLLVKHPLFASVKEVHHSLNSDSVNVEFSLLNADGGRVATVTKSFKLLKKFTDKRDKLIRELSDVEGVLTTSLQKLRDLPRKERQIKARIVERKLENSGMSDLLEDTEMQNLIALD